MEAPERGQVTLVLPLSALGCGSVSGHAVTSPGCPRITPPLITRAST
jgi:hypothetical protein